MFVNYMNKLPPADKEKLAQYLENAAHNLRFEVARERDLQKARDAVKRHRDNNQDARDMLTGYIWQGMDTRRAAAMVQRQTGIGQGWLDLWIKNSAAKIAREKRNRKIMQAAARGWTSTQIADHHGLHKNSVDRIISKMRKR